jgi:hypothetical protein
LKYTVECKLILDGNLIGSLGKYSVNAKTKDEAHYQMTMYFWRHVRAYVAGQGTDFPEHGHIALRMEWCNNLTINVPEDIVSKVKQISCI